jgi:dihydrofolate reductase / thymidylate synthase
MESATRSTLVEGFSRWGSSILMLPFFFPYCLSIEKVSIIGGGQVLRWVIDYCRNMWSHVLSCSISNPSTNHLCRVYLNGPACEAIHLTDIESEYWVWHFHPSNWLLSIPAMVFIFLRVLENNIRHSFVTYVRVRKSVVETHDSNRKESTEVDKKWQVRNWEFLFPP